jgi:glycosyltransferase involved in cell wall biosynthesis
LAEMPEVRRFAIVAPNFHPRVCGIGDHSARLGAELQRRGHEVVIFSRDPVRRNPEVPDLEAHGVAGRSPTAIARGVSTALAKSRPTDVILQYTSQMWDTWRFGSPALVLLASLARQAGARVTLIAHEPFVPWSGRPDLFLGALIQRAQFAALLKICHHTFVTTETRLRYVEPYSSGLGVATPGVTRIGANALPLPPRVPGHGSNGSDGNAGMHGPAPGPRIGVFSTAGVGKRFDVVLDAFAQIASEVPSADLVLLGDLGPPDRPAVREIRDALGRHPAGARIRVTGRLTLSRIAAEIAGLDVYLFPMNTGANTRSCTLPVALGSGLPVVATFGIETDRSLFRDGENIVMARELSGPAFAEATLRLLRDATLMSRVRAGARELYAAHLSWEQIADVLLAAI